MDLAGCDWRDAGLAAGDAALCAYAEKLTRTPAAMCEADVEQLRGFGYSDFEIHDAIQVVSYFNYINRIADAVHVDLEPEMPPYPQAGSGSGSRVESESGTGSESGR